MAHPVAAPPWTIPRAVGLAALPGLLGGMHLVALVYFLNPGIPLTVSGLTQASAVYATLLAAATALAALPVALRNPGRVARALPWATTAVLAVAAASYGFHASRYAYYLPEGVNLRLLKAAVWLGLAGLVTFYTAFLHTVMRRRYGGRSRWGLVAVAAATIYAAVERREAFRPPREPHPRTAAAVAPEPLRLVVVGIEGAGLEAVLPLARRGDLPFLGNVLETGAYGRLRTLAPTWRAAVWTTLATGTYPFHHGVRAPALYPVPGFGPPLSLLPAGAGLHHWALRAPPMPLPELPEDALEIWQMLERIGLRSSVGSWPGPVTGLDGGLDLAQLPLALADRSLDAAFLVVPDLADLSRATFGGFDAVHARGSTRPADELAAERLAAGYIALDRQLASLAASADERPTVFAIVSAHGTRPARSGLLRRPAVRGTTDGAPDGLFLLAGPGVAAGRPVGELPLVDVVPTLLYALGLPIARDLDGRVATAAFTDELLARRGITFVPSYAALVPPAAGTVRP